MFSFITIMLGVAFGIIIGNVVMVVLGFTLMFSSKLQNWLVNKYTKLIRKVEDKFDEEDIY